MKKTTKENVKAVSKKETSAQNKELAVAKKDNALSTRVTVVNSKRKPKTPISIGALFAVVTITLLLVFVVMNYAEIDNYNSDIAELRDELTELQKSAVKLEQRLDKKNDLVDFEEYAVNELYMVKSGGLTRINITALPEDRGTTYKYDSDKSGIGLLLSGFGEVFKNFID